MPSDKSAKPQADAAAAAAGGAGAASTIFRFNAKYVAVAHATTAYAAFLGALGVGCLLHYRKIVQNAFYGYPDEWFPSVSAAIGDRYPERSLFQVFIALTSGPRFVLILLNFAQARPRRAAMAWTALAAGVARTFTCGGWVYITSTDDHDWHDIFMISYIVLTIPWTVAVSASSPRARAGRIATAALFFATLVPLVYWFVQHKVHARAGAYSVYAYFEWALILLDVAFDTWSVAEFADVEIVVRAASPSTGIVKPAVKPPVVTEIGESPLAAAAVATASATGSPPLSAAAAVAAASATGSLAFAVDVINSAMFWTILTSLLLCVWYFPLWYMGLSGYEAVVAVMFLAPLLVAVPRLRRFGAAHPQVARALAVLLGLGAYRIDDPAHRLVAITAGTACAAVALVCDFGAAQATPERLDRFAVSFVVGLLATSALKFACRSNNPFWPIMNADNGGWNNVGIFVGLVAALLAPAAPPETPKPAASGSVVLAAIGLGGYFFSVQSFLSDSSTLTLWAWDGFPVRGPTPLTGALPHFASVMLGVLASVRLTPRFLGSSVYNVVGAVAASTLWRYSHWAGFGGSCVYVFYLASLAPVMWRSASAYNPAVVVALAMLCNVVVSLASIWTVAYAFVPAGWVLRERIDLVLAASYAMTVAGVLNYNWRYVWFSAAPNVRLSVPTFKAASRTLCVILAFCIAATFSRVPKECRPYNPASHSFTAGIWCVHFGLDNDMWSSETRMLNLLRDAEVDIVGLLESDTQRLIGGNRDFTQTIAEELGMYVDYGPGPNKHTWGAALLSKFPIVNSTHHLLPSPVGELAPAIHATLDIYGELIDVVVFHSGQEEDVEDRRLQSLAIEEIMAQSPRPLVLLSYLVTEPLEGNYHTYVSERSRMHDIDSTDWDRWCEYILFRQLKKIGYARISRSTITDTELQIAKFRLLGDADHSATANKLYGNNYVDESEVEEGLRFPAMFRGEGVRGHFYHVFDEPRYYRQ
ncbi:Protein CWH43 [[Candida] zeylanoides]